jgi:hypothetical protein
VLKNAAVPAPERLRVYALKRFAAQARRQVVPSWPCSRTPSYAPPAQVAAAFPSRGLRTDWTGPFGQTQGMLFEHSLIFFVWLSVTHMWINRQNLAFIQQSHSRRRSGRFLELSVDDECHESRWTDSLSSHHGL